jgi:glycosyltransferase involved in cell wall biosynthesis
MGEGPETIVVVPCLDEAARLDLPRFEAFLRAAPDVGLVLVDDGSRDGTGERLRALAAAFPERVEALALPENRGKAEAVRQGALRALARGPVWFGYWDADLSTPLEAIPLLRALLRQRPELSLVQGARVALLGHRIERRVLRHCFGRVGATAISRVLRLAVYDTQCGAKLFRASAETRALFDEPFASRWMLDVEILARWIQRRGSPERLAGALFEYPLPEWRDVAGSKLRPLDYLRAARDLLRIRRALNRGRS